MATLYETDFARWAAEQAGLLRAGLVNSIDYENLAEEMEIMGSSELSELENRLTVLIMHLLKYRFQPNLRSRSWLLTIKEQRKRIAIRLKRSPSLKPRLENSEFVQDAWEVAVLAASKETGLDESVFPESPIWTIVQILDEGFYPAEDGQN